MGLNLEYSEGQSPLDFEEIDCLKVSSVNNRHELDELEQLNIEQAIKWIISRRFSKEKVLNESFIKEIHKRMFEDVWTWAGSFRRSDKNIGVDWTCISIELRTLLDDTKYWIENSTFEPDEIAIRFKHKIVKIHCFPNGNGRHSRLMADILIEKLLSRKIFTWMNSNLVLPGDARKEYMAAIREADNGDYARLMKFARS